VTRVIGLMLVRDEDIYIEQTVRNVADFCDELIVLDNRSQDETWRILSQLADEGAPLRLHSIRHPRTSHAYVSHLAGEDLWVFGVDGDELYDPRGLAALRPRLLSGELRDWWVISGNVLHCCKIDPARRLATGYLAPPSRSMTKLYNFSVLQSWEGDSSERLHGGNLIFKPGYGERRYHLRADFAWEESPFRCLHMCFVRRSSRQPPSVGGRPSSLDAYWGNWRSRLVVRAKERLGLVEERWEPKRAYRRGEPVTVDVAAFFPDAACVE
jgi:glycosyltransferase involved in cell wall biosynthesis